MQIARPAGRNAGVIKYDLLTALGSHALACGKSDQRRALRLITLITARYNWSRNELCVGQREIARMWSCDERTVKREMARLRGQGWLVLRQQGARGRVARYQLALEAIFADTRDQHENVGPDFALRREAAETPPEAPKVVSFPNVAPPDISSAEEWPLAQAILHSERPEIYGAWIARLKRAERAGGRLTLRAPSRFHASYVSTHLLPDLLSAVQAVDPDVSELVLIA